MKLCIIFEIETNRIMSYGEGHDTLVGGTNIEVDDDSEALEPFKKKCSNYAFRPNHNPCLVFSDACADIGSTELKLEQSYDRLIELDKLRSGQALERYLLDGDKSGLEAIREEAEACRVFIRENTVAEE